MEGVGKTKQKHNLTNVKVEVGKVEKIGTERIRYVDGVKVV